MMKNDTIGYLEQRFVEKVGDYYILSCPALFASGFNVYGDAVENDDGTITANKVNDTLSWFTTIEDARKYIYDLEE